MPFIVILHLVSCADAVFTMAATSFTTTDGLKVKAGMALRPGSPLNLRQKMVAEGKKFSFWDFLKGEELVVLNISLA